MFKPKPLSRDGIPRALEKAERYRLLNEPVEAESICLDVLEADSRNGHALVTLLLALTDQFEEEAADTLRRARALLPRLADDYQRHYYAGLICERRAKAQLKRGGPGSGYVSYQFFREAMAFYEKAEAIRPPGNDDALLRWNACARIVERHAELRPAPEEPSEPLLE